jgi:hypothetical protein
MVDLGMPVGHCVSPPGRRFSQSFLSNFGYVLRLSIGFISHNWGWRTMQLYLGALALVAFLVFLLAFPETSHPGSRGIDKFRQSGHSSHKWAFTSVNPLAPLSLLRSPNLCTVVRSYLRNIVRHQPYRVLDSLPRGSFCY